ncbi:TRAP transporter permease [Psychrobacillus sp. NPDC096426]|uniref:TRAP transporter permease n=1 Tax=Psychrobacillus sp. NPDC096426 TaxID=3364491 RepID=UPI00380BC190
MSRLNYFWRVIIVIFTIIGVTLSINMLFYLNLFGISPMENSFLYYLLACFMSIAFLLFPAKKNDADRLPWYDILLFGITAVIAGYFGMQGERIVLEGWDWIAPLLPTILSIFFWVLVLEVLRRTGGTAIAIVCLVFSLYPLVASDIPISLLQGQSYDFLETARNHIMSSNGVLGIAFSSVGNLILGFLVFGIVITRTGGGDFFFNIAQSLFGKTRGGTAKVAVVGSAFFGMLSGSAVSNAVTIGSMTIPAMKKSGYKPHYAAAVEAVASTGGSITPPIMGSAAFIMASFLGLPYYQIALAAVIPAVLYYVGLYIQIDGHAAKHNLKGMPESEIPSLWKTLKNGWYYLFALVLLIAFLGILNSEAQAPYYASVVLVLIAIIKKENRWGKKQIFEMFEAIGKVLSEIVCIIAGVGFIVGALSATGVSFSFSRELVAAAGDNTFLILVGGALTCFILGMGMTVSAVYVFLAIIMAPALVAVGIDPMAAHLFVIYWATVSYITPPVALAAFATASIADASPMRTGFQAVQLGMVKFIVPFYMVYKPAILLGRGDSIFETVIAILSVLLGVFVLASALEGYLLGGGIINPVVRLTLGISGIAMFFPGLIIHIIAIALIILIFLYQRLVVQKKNTLEMSTT